MKVKDNRGFTLIEVLVCMGVIGLLVGVSISAYLPVQEKHQIDTAQQTVSQAFRSAQSRSKAVDGDQSWGVYVQTGRVTLFQGTSYALRDTDFDEDYEVSSSIMLSGLTEIVFSKFYGEPNSTGTLTLESEYETRAVHVNEKGFLSY